MRYFRPGVNWAGRTIYGIPVFGFALLAMSQGAYALRDGWVLGGVALFAGVALLAEGVLWPAERRLQAAAGGRSRAPTARSSRGHPPTATRGRWRWAARGALLLLVAGVVLMSPSPDVRADGTPEGPRPVGRSGRLGGARRAPSQLQPRPPPTGGGSL